VVGIPCRFVDLVHGGARLGTASSDVNWTRMIEIVLWVDSVIHVSALAPLRWQA